MYIYLLFFYPYRFFLCLCVTGLCVLKFSYFSFSFLFQLILLTKTYGLGIERSGVPFRLISSQSQDRKPVTWAIALVLVGILSTSKCVCV